MVFSSLVFLFIFLPVTLAVYFISPQKLKNTVLLLASLIFYAWGEPKYIVIMLFSIFINYLFGWIVSSNNEKIRKAGVLVCVLANIGILGIFKYAGFIADNLSLIPGINIKNPNISLPLGISFFTFQAMSYVIDVYRKEASLQKNIFNLALYISLFPQLVAGPIVRYQTIEEQINKRNVTIDGFAEGIRRFIIGAFKKVIIANSLGMAVDTIFSMNIQDISTVSRWIAVIGYSLQIFFDFSGYSDMAIGLGKMFGFEFLENFNYPYIAKSADEFWRRWHISLSTWFRDYVYIPLGGSRKGKSRTYINLMIVWLLTGFWHGASWTFMAWGIYFGILICMEKAFLKEKVFSKLPSAFSHVYLIVAVAIGWIFFRADNFEFSYQILKKVFFIGNVDFFDGTAYAFINDYWFVFLLGIFMSLPYSIIPGIKKIKLSAIFSEGCIQTYYEILILGMMFIVTVYKLVNSTYNPFLYFRF